MAADYKGKRSLLTERPQEQQRQEMNGSPYPAEASVDDIRDARKRFAGRRFSSYDEERLWVSGD